MDIIWTFLSIVSNRRVLAPSSVYFISLCFWWRLWSHKSIETFKQNWWHEKTAALKKHPENVTSIHHNKKHQREKTNSNPLRPCGGSKEKQTKCVHKDQTLFCWTCGMSPNLIDMQNRTDTIQSCRLMRSFRWCFLCSQKRLELGWTLTAVKTFSRNKKIILWLVFLNII